MVKNYRAYKFAPVILLVTIFSSFILYAYSTGITGRTLKNGTGCDCHSATPNPLVSVVISGPDSLQVNTSATYTVTITGGPLTRGGTNIAASNGLLAPVSSDLQIMSGELTHVAPKAPSAGSVTFQFTYTAPGTTGNQILYANGNSVNFNGTNTGDSWNYASNKTVLIVPVVPVELTGFTASVSVNNVLLNWTTATETNNYGFEIMRSVDRTDWKVISFIEGAGNSAVTKYYSYDDNNLTAGNYYYRLRQIDYNGSSEYFGLENMISIAAPSDFSLSQNYPNPFNPSTRIEYSIPFDGDVQLKVYNPLGKEVAELTNGYTSKGSYSSDFNASDLSSGVYFYELKVTGQNRQSLSSIKKMILLK